MIESNLKKWIKNNIVIIAYFFLFIIGLLIRFVFFDKTNGDLDTFLIPWYNEMKENGGIWALKRSIGDYYIPYLLCLAIMTYIPVSPIYLIKVLSALFDLLLAVTVANI